MLILKKKKIVQVASTFARCYVYFIFCLTIGHVDQSNALANDMLILFYLLKKKGYVTSASFIFKMALVASAKADAIGDCLISHLIYIADRLLYVVLFNDTIRCIYSLDRLFMSFLYGLGVYTHLKEFIL